MPKVINLLLTYTCPLRCKHCYVFSNPRAKGKFTNGSLKEILNQMVELDSVEWIIFNGGEPFWHFQLLLSGIKQARRSGFKVGVITNGYFARTEGTAANFLRPIRQLKVSHLYISDDTFHYNTKKDTPAKRALRAAASIGIPSSRVCIGSNPNINTKILAKDDDSPKFESRLKLRGRAATLSTDEINSSNWHEFTQCPLEDMDKPERISIDPFGNVSVCQGLTLGNAFISPLKSIIKSFKIENHPVLSLLKKGGPALLTKHFSIQPENGYGDACHLCFMTRTALMDLFPQYLAPKQVYGL